MKVRVISDLHFEHHRDLGDSLIKEIGSSDDEILVLAGDIATGKPLLKDTLHAFADNFPNVIYVVGNHEYYGFGIQEIQDFVQSTCSKKTNLHFLEKSLVEIDGITIAGTSLWFRDQMDNSFYEDSMNDFHVIKGFKEWVYEDNQKCIEFLDGLKQPDVIVTHHLPHNSCVHDRYKNSPLTRFFLCEVDDIIQKQSPKLWVHGHTHHIVDATIGSTRIVCNPFGYPMELTGFDAGFLVEI